MNLGLLPVYSTVPLAAFFMLQTIPELKGFLDYGATAGLAAYMVWLWNKHTTRWQDKQVEIDAIHRAAMERVVDAHTVLSTRLSDRYDVQVERILQALDRNTESATRVNDALRGMSLPDGACTCGAKECREAKRNS